MLNIEKVELKLSRFDKFLDITGYILLILYWIMVIIAFQKLPEEIPVHYNGAGEVDAFGPKIQFLCYLQLQHFKSFCCQH